MASNSLTTKREGGLIVATLNRPEKLNALNKEIFEEMSGLLDVIESDKTARVLIITGAGDKAFCVGADLKERQAMTEKDVLNRFTVVKKLYSRLEGLRLPVIAAINGTALGGGLELALTCDLRVLTRGATLGFPEVDLAIIPGNGGTQRLSRMIGVSRALELILLAKRFDADAALAYGVVHRVVDKDCLSVAKQWATKMMESGPIAIQQAKMAIRAGSQLPLDQGIDVEVEAYKACLRSQDRVEGLEAFKEKRKPVYKGV